MARKRQNGSGSVRKLPGGSWHCQLMDGYKSDGKKNIVFFTAPTKKEIQEQVRAYWNRKELEALARDPMAFSQWADTWYASYRSQVQPSTYSGYRYTLKLLKEHFGIQQLTEIKALAINAFYDGLIAEGRARSSVMKCKIMLVQIFDDAVANDMVDSNPARKAHRIHFPPQQPTLNAAHGTKDAFSVDEQTLLRQHLPDNLIGHSIEFMLGTGLRAQEMLALTPEDIAEDGSEVEVTKAIKTVDGMPTIGCPKSQLSFRRIPIPATYRDDALYLRNHPSGSYIWTSSGLSGLMPTSSFRRLYYKELERIEGVRSLSPHCCRHTYVTNLERLGVPMEQIARLVGHSEIKTTNIYLHTAFETLVQAVTVLNESA